MRPTVDVVFMDFLPVMDALSTERADMVLDTGNLLFPGRKGVGFRRRPLCPVVPQTGVVGRRSAFDHDMSLDFEPRELEQVVS